MILIKRGYEAKPHLISSPHRSLTVYNALNNIAQNWLRGRTKEPLLMSSDFLLEWFLSIYLSMLSLLILIMVSLLCKRSCIKGVLTVNYAEKNKHLAQCKETSIKYFTWDLRKHIWQQKDQTVFFPLCTMVLYCSCSDPRSTWGQYCTALCSSAYFGFPLQSGSESTRYYSNSRPNHPSTL